MATNYTNWSVSKLTKERDKIDKAIEAKSGEQKNSLIAKAKKMAAESGFELAELFGNEAPAAKPARKKRTSSKKIVGKKQATKKKAGDKRRGPAPRNYRNPEDHDQTWSGRGRPPRWAAEYLNAGWVKDDLRF